MSLKNSNVEKILKIEDYSVLES